MADAWTTVVHRESEWTPAARAEAIAAVLAEQLRCPNCGNTDSVVPAPRPVSDKDPRGPKTTAPRAWYWPARRRNTPPPADERAYEIHRYRCVACAGKAVSERDYAKTQENHTPSTGVMSPADGLFFSIRPHYPQT